MVAQIGEQLGSGLDEVDVVAVAFLGLAPLRPGVRVLRGNAVVDQAAMLMFEQVELALDQIAEPHAPQPHAS